MASESSGQSNHNVMRLWAQLTVTTEQRQVNTRPGNPAFVIIKYPEPINVMFDKTQLYLNVRCLRGFMRSRAYILDDWVWVLVGHANTPGLLQVLVSL